MEEPASMASTATIVHASPASPDPTANTKSTNVIRRHAKTERHASIKTTTTSVTVRTAFKANNVRTS